MARTLGRTAGLLGALAAGLLAAGCALLHDPGPVSGAYSVEVAGPHGPVRLHAEESGRGEPLLLLHGYGSSTHTWRHVVPELARTHRVVALDLKGYGRSDKPFDSAYGLHDQAALVRAFMEARRLRNVTVVGHSLGGGVALVLTLDANRTRPGLVRKLVLIDSPAYRQPLPPTVVLLNTPGVGEAMMHAVPPEVLSKIGLYAAYRDPGKITLDDVLVYARPLYEAGGRHAVIETARQIEPSDIDAMVKRIPTITQPTLLLWCRSDRVVPVSTGIRLSREMPNARLEVYDDCDHVPHEELPERVVAAMRRFL